MKPADLQALQGSLTPQHFAVTPSKPMSESDKRAIAKMMNPPQPKKGK